MQTADLCVTSGAVGGAVLGAVGDAVLGAVWCAKENRYAGQQLGT